MAPTKVNIPLNDESGLKEESERFFQVSRKTLVCPSCTLVGMISLSSASGRRRFQCKCNRSWGCQSFLDNFNEKYQTIGQSSPNGSSNAKKNIIYDPNDPVVIINIKKKKSIPIPQSESPTDIMVNEEIILGQNSYNTTISKISDTESKTENSDTELINDQQQKKKFASANCEVVNGNNCPSPIANLDLQNQVNHLGSMVSTLIGLITNLVSAPNYAEKERDNVIKTLRTLGFPSPYSQSSPNESISSKRKLSTSSSSQNSLNNNNIKSSSRYAALSESGISQDSSSSSLSFAEMARLNNIPQEDFDKFTSARQAVAFKRSGPIRPANEKVSPDCPLVSVYASGFSRIPISQLKKHLFTMRFSLSKIVTLSYIGTSIIEFIIIQDYEKILIQKLKKLNFEVLEKYDPTVPTNPLADQETKERIKSACIQRVQRLADTVVLPSAKNFFEQWLNMLTKKPSPTMVETSQPIIDNQGIDYFPKDCQIQYNLSASSIQQVISNSSKLMELVHDTSMIIPDDESSL